MTSLPDNAFQNPPACLSRFETALVNIPLPKTVNAGPHSFTRSVKCSCGNESLQLQAAQQKQLKGVCVKTEDITFNPPVYVSCPSCKRFTLLFDPLLHGWNGETTEDDSHAEYRLANCTPQPGRIYVHYTYQQPEKYAKLAQSGISRLEDYFDSFSVIYGYTSGERFIKIVACTCG